MPLTAKMKAWADYFIETGNKTESSRKAGYKGSDATLAAIGYENFNKPEIAAYIAERTKPDEDKRIATADEVMQFLTDVMQGRVKDSFGLDASLSDRINASKELMKRLAVGGYHGGSQQREDDPLTKSLMEEAERLNNADQR